MFIHIILNINLGISDANCFTRFEIWNFNEHNESHMITNTVIY